MENIFSYSQLATLPKHLKTEVADFMDFLVTKTKNDSSYKSKKNSKLDSGQGIFKMNPDLNDFLTE